MDAAVALRGRLRGVPLVVLRWFRKLWIGQAVLLKGLLLTQLRYEHGDILNKE